MSKDKGLVSFYVVFIISINNVRCLDEKNQINISEITEIYEENNFTTEGIEGLFNETMQELELNIYGVKNSSKEVINLKYETEIHPLSNDSEKRLTNTSKKNNNINKLYFNDTERINTTIRPTNISNSSHHKSEDTRNKTFTSNNTNSNDDDTQSFDTNDIVVSRSYFMPEDVTSKYRNSSINNDTNVVAIPIVNWFKLTGAKELNKSLTIYNQINQNISFAVFLESVKPVKHLITIYGTYVIKNHSKTEIMDSNLEMERIISNLSDILWPKNETDLLNKVIFSKKELLKLVQVDTNRNYFLLRDFVANIYMDPNLLRCGICYCDIFKSSDENKQLFICLLPYVSPLSSDLIMDSLEIALKPNNWTLFVNNLIKSFRHVASLILVVAIVIIYACMKELRQNVYGKCIVLFLISFAITLFLEIIAGADLDHNKGICATLGFAEHYFWMVTISLQTVMTYDILVAFRSMKTASDRSQNKTDLKLKLYKYCACAYGIPAVFILLIIILQYTPIMEAGNKWKPNMGEKSCRLYTTPEDRRLVWTYIYGPITTVVIINGCMFLATILSIWKQKKAAKVLKGSESTTSKENNNKMFLVQVTLFLITGSSWILEIVPIIFLHDEHPSTYNILWRFVNFLNSSIGAILFIMLVLCKPKIMEKLKETFVKNIIGKKIVENFTCLFFCSIYINILVIFKLFDG